MLARISQRARAKGRGLRDPRAPLSTNLKVLPQDCAPNASCFLAIRRSSGVGHEEGQVILPAEARRNASPILW